jgi:threonine/homoserine/homoserine lactone efflux protein
MPNASTLSLYFGAALMLAISPGPGMFYVLTRSIKGGRFEGYVSALGTAVGGLFHVVAAALGLSAILMASTVLFSVIKYLGAAYLVYLGIHTLLSKDDLTAVESGPRRAGKAAFTQGIVTEILNPKTALFFLAFIPQFIALDQPVVPQFIVLGCIAVLLNTSVDFVVASFSGPLGTLLRRNPKARRAPGYLAGSGLIALGLFVAFSGSEQNAQP